MGFSLHISKSYYDYCENSILAGGAEHKTVLVYLHGGGPGGGITDLLMTPDFFLAQDNIVVYLTFRVQIFGFLNLGFGDYTGNMAMKDQQLGMKWVYDNIEYFSGKKDEILLFGDSSGECCTAFLGSQTFSAFIRFNKKG